MSEGDVSKQKPWGGKRKSKRAVFVDAGCAGEESKEEQTIEGGGGVERNEKQTNICNFIERTERSLALSLLNYIIMSFTPDNYQAHF